MPHEFLTGIDLTPISFGWRGNLAGVVIADPDETCPGLWVELGGGLGYCDLGDQCRNPILEAHARHVDERSTADDLENGDDA